MKRFFSFTIFMVLTLISGCKLQNSPQSDASHNAVMETLAQKTSQQSASFGTGGAIAVVKNYHDAIERGQYQ